MASQPIPKRKQPKRADHWAVTTAVLIRTVLSYPNVGIGTCLPSGIAPPQAGPSHISRGRENIKIGRQR